MVKRKKRTCITQSGKNYAINWAIQAVRLIWKHLIGHLWVCLIIDQSECLICFLFLHWINSFLHCFQKNCTALNQSTWRNFFIYITSFKNSTIKWKIESQVANLLEKNIEMACCGNPLAGGEDKATFRWCQKGNLLKNKTRNLSHFHNFVLWDCLGSVIWCLHTVCLDIVQSNNTQSKRILSLVYQEWRF